MRRLDGLLPVFASLWHPQPFREVRPAWCDAWPDLTERLLALPDEVVDGLNNDSRLGLQFLAGYFPGLAEFVSLSELPDCAKSSEVGRGSRWARDIPGRKQAQIEAFVASAGRSDLPVLDWCGGKGHLGRLMALDWQVSVHTLEVDAVLCRAGHQLAARQALPQHFLVEDALTVEAWPQAGQHAVALHACGELHRRLIERGVAKRVGRFDIAPCCYYRGVGERYRPLSGALHTTLTRDDTRLAVTETVTASPRLARQRDKEMAWKLGYDHYRRQRVAGPHKSFKPVPAAWFRGSFHEFLKQMAIREDLPVPASGVADAAEAAGWLRQREVMRLSIVRHAFRRALEVWLVLDLAVYLQGQGYEVSVGCFCERELTPRNLLISAGRLS